MRHFRHVSICFLSIAALPAVLAATPAKDIKPPKEIKVDPELTDEQLEKMPVRTQPKALSDTLAALQVGTLEERIEKLKKKVLADMVPVKGGTFMMGDFGKLWAPEKLYYTIEKDNKPVHKVTLSDFSISRYKTTHAEFDIYAEANKKPKAGTESSTSDSLYRHPIVPAGVRWDQADAYCQWLGKITGQPFALPTEAQWEYSARSRGQFFVFSTNNGHVEYGKNIIGFKQLDYTPPFKDAPSPFPIGLFPPSPIGLYDLSYGGFDWVQDWYSSDYYAKSPEKDPKGPEKGEQKVLRGWSFDSMAPTTIWRHSRFPNGDYLRKTDDEGHTKREREPLFGDNIRCAMSK